MIPIGRRNFIARMGLGAGAYLLSPVCRKLIREAHGQAPTDKRLVFLNYGGSARQKDRIIPEVNGETIVKFKESLRDLEPLRDRVIVATQFVAGPRDPLHGSGSSWVRFRGAAVYDWVASKLGTRDPLPTIKLHLVDKGGEGGTSGVTKASVAFAQVFGAPGGSATPATSGQNIEQLLARRKSVLDFIVRDIEVATRDLAGLERAKLEEYLDSIRRLERKLMTPSPVAMPTATLDCRNPRPPAAELDKPVDGGGSSPERVAFTVELIVAAMACQRTHVATYSLHGNYKAFGYDTAQYKPLEWHARMLHGGVLPERQAIDRIQFGSLARIYQGLAQYREGDGTMADQTLILWTDSFGGEHHHGAASHPLLVIGNPGRRLRSGRYVVTSGTMEEGYGAALRGLGLDGGTGGPTFG